MTNLNFGRRSLQQGSKDFSNLRDGAKIPGYGGYIPHMKYSIGKTYGNDTFELAKTFKHGYPLLPPIKSVCSRQVVKGVLQHKSPSRDTTFSKKMQSGYAGYIPQLKIGNTYKIDCCIDEHLTINAKKCQGPEVDLYQSAHTSRLQARSYDTVDHHHLNTYRDKFSASPISIGSRQCLDMEMDKYSDTAHLEGQQTKLMEYINNNIIGKEQKFDSPFGPRTVLYCDYTASGRSLMFLEKFVHEHVLPNYGNVHTTSTVTSRQTTSFRQEARDIIRKSVNAGNNDVVIFTGSGCTGAVQKLLHALDLSIPPVVFVSIFEHHSNLLPWRELSYKTVVVQETEQGELNLTHLEHELQVWQFSGRPLIGSFIAASNVTGYLLDTVAIAELLHRYGALALFDYATAGPYIKIDMNPIIPGHDPKLTLKDAIFLSPHKFIGGVQTPGILVAKRHLFQCAKPMVAGGGTVVFVTRDHQSYHEDLEVREEGGTPAIVESIRAGLVFQLKDCVGVLVIEDRENELVRRALKVFSTTPDLVLLGSTVPKRLPIFSFLIRHRPTGLYLHHNFVCTLLNDLFGVQVRGGCMCAGPLGMELLGISDGLGRNYENVLGEVHKQQTETNLEILKPGFIRLTLTYFMSDEEVEFVLEAVKMVAEYGWTLLPQYKFSPHSGDWTHYKHTLFTDRRWLGQVSYSQGHMTYEPDIKSCQEPIDWKIFLSKAQFLFEEAPGVSLQLGDQALLFEKHTAGLRWFLLPSEAYQSLKGMYLTPHKLPWKPAMYPCVKVKAQGWTWCQCSSAQSQCCEAHKDIAQ